MFGSESPGIEELKLILYVVLPIWVGVYYHFYYLPAKEGAEQCQQYCERKGYQNYKYLHPGKANLGKVGKKCQCKR